MLHKTVTICGKEVAFRASATIPCLYRIKFRRDIFKDLSKLESVLMRKLSVSVNTAESLDVTIRSFLRAGGRCPSRYT